MADRLIAKFKACLHNIQVLGGNKSKNTIFGGECTEDEAKMLDHLLMISWAPYGMGGGVRHLLRMYAFLVSGTSYEHQVLFGHLSCHKFQPPRASN